MTGKVAGKVTGMVTGGGLNQDKANMYTVPRGARDVPCRIGRNVLGLLTIKRRGLND